MWHLIFFSLQNLSIVGVGGRKGEKCKKKKKDSISLLFMCKNIEGGILKEITISSIKGRTNLALNREAVFLFKR